MQPEMINAQLAEEIKNLSEIMMKLENKEISHKEANAMTIVIQKRIKELGKNIQKPARKYSE